jgi:1-acyl-sn-glycerol-3-phosphate acyltransferase
VGSALNRAWRVIGTGLSFATFGLGGMLLGGVVFPLVRLLVRDEARRTRFSRFIIHQTFRFFIWEMSALGVLSYELHGVEKLNRPGLLVLANHPTLIDVIFLMSVIPQADCVVKAALARNFFTRGAIRAARYVSNDEGLALLTDSLHSLKHGNTLIIFPEGTRTPRTGELALQRGAANIAVRGPVDVTPVIIRCTPLTLGKGEKWYRVPERRAHFTIEVGDDVPVKPFLEAASEPLAARRLTAWLKTFFEQEGRRGAA